MNLFSGNAASISQILSALPYWVSIFLQRPAAWFVGGMPLSEKPRKSRASPPDDDQSLTTLHRKFGGVYHGCDRIVAFRLLKGRIHFQNRFFVKSYRHTSNFTPNSAATSGAKTQRALLYVAQESKHR